VVHGIAGAGDLKKVGRVGVKALIYFEVMTTVALVVGLLLAYLFGPGHGMNIDTSTLDPKALSSFADNAHKLQGGGIGSFLMNIFRPPLSTRCRAMTCSRCCSSRSFSASASRWSEEKRASASGSLIDAVSTRSVPGDGLIDRIGRPLQHAQRGQRRSTPSPGTERSITASISEPMRSPFSPPTSARLTPENDREEQHLEHVIARQARRKRWSE